MQSTSLYLDPDSWDLTLNANGALKTVSNPYSIAQDVACALKTVLGECYFDNTIGIPYYEQLLGRPVTISTVISKLKTESERLSTVKSANVTLVPDRSTRVTKGYITITDTNSESSTLVL